MPDLALSTQSITPPATPERSTRTYKDILDQMRIANSVIPDNRIVVHELSIDKEYRIAIEDCLEKRDSIRRNTLASMRRDLASGHGELWVLSLANTIKTNLQKGLQPGNSLHSLIEANLDSDLISQELETGSFSYEKFFVFLANVLPRLCAPFRDDEVKALQVRLAQDGDVVDRLELLMHFVDCLQLDHANFLLQYSSQELIKHAITYERKIFADNLSSNVHDLSRTQLWWSTARAKVLAEVVRRDPEGINLARTRPSPDKFYAQMLLDVFTDLNDNQPPPETLQLDSRRITKLKSCVRNIVTAGAVLLQAKNLMKRDVRSQWKAEAARIISVLENASAADAAQGIQAALESSRSMPTATKAHISSTIRRIVENSYANAEGHVSITEPVLRLLLVRLRGHILARLSAITASEKVKATSTASESLATLGLPEFVSQVGRIVDELARVGAVDRDAHGEWYESVAKMVELS